MARDRYCKLVPYPLGKIGKQPAHHAIRSRDRTCLDDLSKADTLFVVQDRCAPGRFARCQTIGSICVEAQDQSRTICNVTPPNFAASLRLPPSRINATASNRRT